MPRPARNAASLSLPTLPLPALAPEPPARPSPASLPSSPLVLRVAQGTRAWVGVVSRAHVHRGVAGGFAQLCHGKASPLRRMAPGDFLVYYSPTLEMGGAPLRSFTAIGRVADRAPYAFDMGGGFVPTRRDIAYFPEAAEVPINTLAPDLDFITQNPSWGMLARRGHFEIGLRDLAVIARAMKAPLLLG